ncbi:D-alanyl-D-alanine carboxypeptidase family protein [Paenarthrobacter sp. Z7-10]|nr:D-alanyl-D-alanine carboxypeptidase family protein [Paenarthrobacter sp. Z7-10]
MAAGAALAACTAPSAAAGRPGRTTATAGSAPPAPSGGAPRVGTPVGGAATATGAATETTEGTEGTEGTVNPAADSGPTAANTPAARPAGLTPSSDSPVHALKRQFSLTDPNSPWVLVNKHHPLHPAKYEPADLVSATVPAGSGGGAALLRAEAANALARMVAAAATAGAGITVLSSYRSYGTQVSLYNGYVAGTGVADADTKSARPGYSEHQTGLAFDIGDSGGACAFDPCFADQPAAAWAAANAHGYGFLIRYQLGRARVTGYLAEPWHLRYVGVELAADLVARRFTTFEEYLGLPAAPDYA